jgi:hypothetical protein
MSIILYDKKWHEWHDLTNIKIDTEWLNDMNDMNDMIWPITKLKLNDLMTWNDMNDMNDMTWPKT